MLIPMLLLVSAAAARCRASADLDVDRPRAVGDLRAVGPVAQEARSSDVDGHRAAGGLQQQAVAAAGGWVGVPERAARDRQLGEHACGVDDPGVVLDRVGHDEARDRTANLLRTNDSAHEARFRCSVQEVTCRYGDRGWSGASSGSRTSTASPARCVASGGCLPTRWPATCSARWCRGGGRRTCSSRTAPGSTSTSAAIPSTPPPSATRSPTSWSTTRRGSGSSSGWWPRPSSACGRRASEASSTCSRTTPTRRATPTGATRTTSPAGATTSPTTRTT